MNKISKNSLLIITIILLVLTFIFGYVFNNYSYINKLIPTLVNFTLVVVFSYTMFVMYRTITELEKYPLIKSILFGILSAIFVILIIGNNTFTKFVNKVTDEKELYSSVIIVRKDSPISKLDDLENKKIGISEDSKDYENNFIMDNYLKENEKTNNEYYKYVDYLLAINDLLSGKIDALIISSNYVDMYEEYFKELENNTKIIAGPVDQTVITKKAVDSAKVKDTFTVLIVGADQNNGSFNADLIILMTINTKTNKTVMVDVVRDTYAFNYTTNQNDKLAHSGWYGMDTVVNNVSKLFDINIDYYVKVNFNALVSIVDSMGGITYNVPYKYLVNGYKNDYYYVNAGTKLLNGKEVLWLARTRKVEGTNVIVRGVRQMEIIETMASQMDGAFLINNFLTLFDTLGENIKTNAQKQELYYFIQKYINTKTTMTYSLNTLAGTDSSYYSNSLNSDLYTYKYSNDSLKELRNKLLENLK